MTSQRKYCKETSRNPPSFEFNVRPRQCSPMRTACYGARLLTSYEHQKLALETGIMTTSINNPIRLLRMREQGAGPRRQRFPFAAKYRGWSARWDEDIGVRSPVRKRLASGDRADASTIWGRQLSGTRTRTIKGFSSRWRLCFLLTLSRCRSSLGRALMSARGRGIFRWKR